MIFKITFRMKFLDNSPGDSSLYFFLAQLEIGNLQKRWGKYEEAKKAYGTAFERSKDQEIKKAAQELLKLLESQ